MDAQAGVTQEEGHANLIHFLSAVLAFIFYREKDSAASFPRRPLSQILCTNFRTFRGYQMNHGDPINSGLHDGD